MIESGVGQHLALRNRQALSQHPLAEAAGASEPNIARRPLLPGIDLEFHKPPAVARLVNQSMNLSVTVSSVMVRASKPPSGDIDGRPVERISHPQREFIGLRETERVTPIHVDPVDHPPRTRLHGDSHLGRLGAGLHHLDVQDPRVVVSLIGQHPCDRGGNSLGLGRSRHEHSIRAENPRDDRCAGLRNAFEIIPGEDEILTALDTDDYFLSPASHCDLRLRKTLDRQILHHKCLHIGERALLQRWRPIERGHLSPDMRWREVVLETDDLQRTPVAAENQGRRSLRALASCGHPRLLVSLLRQRPLHPHSRHEEEEGVVWLTPAQTCRFPERAFRHRPLALEA